MRILVLCFLLSLESFGQELGFPNQIVLGKRGNFLWDREIKETHLAKLQTSYSPMFYRYGTEGKYKRIHFYGYRLKPFLTKEPEGKTAFKAYRRNKITGHALLGISMLSLTGWSVAGIIDIFDPRISTPYLSKRSAPFLLVAITSFLGGISIDRRGDIHLFQAVNYYNNLSDQTSLLIQ